jgi:hypothetical protein
LWDCSGIFGSGAAGVATSRQTAIRQIEPSVNLALDKFLRLLELC